VAEEPVAAPEPALFEDVPAVEPPAADELRTAWQTDVSPAEEPYEAGEPVSDLHAAWSPAEEVSEEPFVAELPATPFMADEAGDDHPAEAWFVADVQEPAPSPEPLPTRTDTWSGRALGS
jgi:hypothetical protein